MVIDYYEFVGYGLVSDWNVCYSGYGYGICYIWYYGDWDFGVGICQYFFIVLGEYEGVVFFEMDYKVVGFGLFDQDSVDCVLGYGLVVRDFGCVDDFYVWWQFGQQFGWGELVGDYDIGLGKQLVIVNCDQFGIVGIVVD